MNDTKNEQEQLWSQLDQMLPTDENESHSATEVHDAHAASTHTMFYESTSVGLKSTNAEDYLSQYQPVTDEKTSSETEKPSEPVSDEDDFSDKKDVLDDKSLAKDSSKEIDDNGAKKENSPPPESEIEGKSHNETEQHSDESVLASQSEQHEPAKKESIPEPGGYAKPIKYRPSIKAFYPHLSLLLFTTIVFLFPSIATSLFSPKDLEQLPIFLQENLAMIVKGSMLFVSALVIFIVFKQKTSGLISVFGDYLEYKKSLIGKTTIHYADIRTIEVRRCLATSYSPIGDFHIITAKHHLVLQNLYEPFVLKEAILRRKAELKA
ncbi:hypothetical protein [uncultured Alteromonas sp.]|jgi:hypothetical protein|uniref:hypothetical protein n=1 Tax=uncultured Alteromonas sp. TaxID=179113 RepID=UPI0030CC9146|tara:strand:+ start:9746 stop:10711 length:966 start_codon:yes stop_codon:yes gene_type:complete